MFANMYKEKYLLKYPPGISDCGSLNANMYDVSESATSANFMDYFTTQYPLYYNGYTNVKGFDISSILTYIDANRNEEVTIAKFTNNADISVVKDTNGSITFFIHKDNITQVLFAISNLPLPSSLTNLKGYYFSLVKMTSTATNAYFGHDFVGIGIFYFHKPSSYDRVDVIINIQNGRQENIYKCLVGLPESIDDPYVTQPTDQPTGGHGSGDYTSVEDLPPALPSLSAAQCGFVSLWNPTIGELKDLATYIWNDSWWVNQWHHIVSNPLDVILSLGMIPFAPATSETKSEVIFGSGGSSGVECYKITDQMYIIPMGSMHITGLSQSYMDYSPYCKASVFLPYCGMYALDVDDIMDADVALEYHVDIYTGACVAYLTITRTNADGSNVHDVMYQFTGNMLATIPVTGQDHRQFLQSLLFMGASIAATVATAGSAAPAIEGAAAAGDAVAISPALTGVAAGSAINTVMSMKPNVMRSGNLSSNAGMLGKQTPTITMTWSNLCRPETEYEQVGMPIYKSGTLSDFEGFTVVNSVHMENIYCTETERDMIAQALAKGVIV